MFPIGVFTTIAALGLLLGKLLQVFFQVLRKQLPAFDRWVKKHIDPKLRTLQQAIITVSALVFYIIFLPVMLILQTWHYFIHHRDRRTAKNSSTSPEQLQKLSECPDIFTWKAITSNPNTPPKVLLRLGSRFPKELLNNPAFDLMLLENPNLLLTMSKETLRSILLLKNVPIDFLEQAAIDPRLDVAIARVIAQHPKSSEYALEKIAVFGQDKAVRRSLLKRSDLPPSLVKKLKSKED